MLQQILTYYVSGSTAVLQGEGIKTIFSDVSLNISGSEYETGVPGGFKSTIGTIRIELYSGSILIADFPYDQTNLIIDSSSTNFFPLPPTNVNFQLKISSSVFYNSDYYIKILESASSFPLYNSPLYDSIVYDNIANFAIYSSSKYIFEAYTGNNKYNELSLYDITSSLILTSSWVTGSGSVVLELTGSPFYYFDFVTSGSTCCSPTLLSIEGLEYNALKFTYETGSCGIFDSIGVYQSTDQISWSLIFTGSSYPYIISTGSFPSIASYYRLIQHCNNGYNSDSSNVLSFIPSTPPVIPNFYYVTVVGRTNSGTINKQFYYSFDSGSTQIDLGNFDYTTTYQPITSFFIYSGSTLIINPNPCYQYGVGYNGSFNSYCNGETSASGNYGTIISADTTLYINVNYETDMYIDTGYIQSGYITGSSCC